MTWFWFNKKDEDSVSSGVQLDALLGGDRGLADLHDNDAELRIWLAEPLKDAITMVARRADMTLSRYLREFLVIYLYGLHELIYMRDNHTGIYYSPPLAPAEQASGDGNIRFSRTRSVECIPGLGKNIAPIKLFLNEKMKTDLQVLANKAGIPLSHFVREVLVSHLLGHTFLPERRGLWTQAQEEIADAWTEGKIDEQPIRSPTAEEEATLEGKIEILRG